MRLSDILFLLFVRGVGLSFHAPYVGVVMVDEWWWAALAINAPSLSPSLFFLSTNYFKKYIHSWGENGASTTLLNIDSRSSAALPLDYRDVTIR